MTDDFVIPEEAVGALARFLAQLQAGRMWDHYTPDTRELIIANYRPTALAALEAALPHLRAHQPERQSVRANERDSEVNGYHQTGPDEAHHRSQCDTTVCGWPPVKWVDLFGMDPDYGDTSDEAETKALAETATKLGYELGRKEAAEEIAQALEVRREEARADGQRGWPLLTEAMVIARDVGRGTSLTTLETDPYLGWDLT